MPSAKSRVVPIDPVEVRKSILKAIAAAPAPVPVRTLGSLPDFPRKVPNPRIIGLLTDDLASRGIFNWGTAKTPLYWHRDREGVASARILEIAGTAILTAPELTKRAAKGPPKLLPAFVTKVRNGLLKEGQLREVPVLPWTKSKRLVNPKHAEVLEPEVARFLELFGAKRPSEQIRLLLTGEMPPSVPEAPPADEQDLIRDAAEKIFSAVNRIAFSPGATVTFYRLRQQPELAGISKRIFDRAALLLQSDRKALLSVHDHAAALPPEEREGFVTDGLGEFYVSIYVR
jgi:hypothetical protein